MTTQPPAIRALTWNVHGCIGRDGVCDPDRVGKVLDAIQPDISALQEIDDRVRRATPAFSYFGARFGWTSVVAHTLTARDGHYGHIVLSRWPIESLGELDLSVRFREPRKAIVGAVHTPHGTIVVVAVHLGLLPCERRRQFARLRERIAALREGPLLVLGDFNDFPGRGLAERSLCPPLESTPELPTFPARFPLLPLDRIWFTSPLELGTIATIGDADRVSDHLPLLATFNWERQRAGPSADFAISHEPRVAGRAGRDAASSAGPAHRRLHRLPA